MADVEFTMTSNLDLIKDQTEEAILTALEAVGVQAEGYAITEITTQGAIDTGRLKNSITHAVSGDSAHQHAYDDDIGNSFSENIQDAGEGKEQTVYLGTNVHYAPYVEMGTQKMAARPFIRPAIENNISNFQQIFTSVLSKIGK
jgi:HK97 gp10 family phage protein